MFSSSSSFDEARALVKYGLSSTKTLPIIFNIDISNAQLMEKIERALNVEHVEGSFLIALIPGSDPIFMNEETMVCDIPDSKLNTVTFVLVLPKIQANVSFRGTSIMMELDVTKTPVENMQQIVSEELIDDYTFFSLEDPNYPRALDRNTALIKSSLKLNDLILKRCFYVFPRYTMNGKQPTIETERDCKEYIFNSYVKIPQRDEINLAAIDMCINKNYNTPEFPSYTEDQEVLAKKAIIVAQKIYSSVPQNELVKKYIGIARSLQGFGSFRIPIIKFLGNSVEGAEVMEITPFGIKFFDSLSQQVGQSINYPMIQSISLESKHINMQFITSGDRVKKTFVIEMGEYAHSVAFLIAGNVKKNIEGLEARFNRKADNNSFEQYNEDASRLLRMIKVLSEGKLSHEAAFASSLEIASELEGLTSKYSKISEHVKEEYKPATIANEYDLVKKAVDASIDASRLELLHRSNSLENYRKTQKSIEKSVATINDAWSRASKHENNKATVMAADKFLYHLMYLESECEFLSQLREKLSCIDVIVAKSDSATKKLVEDAYMKIATKKSELAK